MVTTIFTLLLTLTPCLAFKLIKVPFQPDDSLTQELFSSYHLNGNTPFMFYIRNRLHPQHKDFSENTFDGEDSMSSSSISSSSSSLSDDDSKRSPSKESLPSSEPEYRPLLQAYLQDLKRSNMKPTPLTLKEYIMSRGSHSMKRKMFWQPLGYVPQRDRTHKNKSSQVPSGGGSAVSIFRYGK